MNKTKQSYNLDAFSQQTQKDKQIVKKEFGSSTDLQQQKLFTEPMTGPFLNFTKRLQFPHFPQRVNRLTKNTAWGNNEFPSTSWSDYKNLRGEFLLGCGGGHLQKSQLSTWLLTNTSSSNLNTSDLKMIPNHGGKYKFDR